MKKELSNEMRDALRSASDLFGKCRVEMAGAILGAMRDICEEDGQNKVIFHNDVDCASCEPVKALVYDAVEEEMYAFDEEMDWPTPITELTGNELFEITQHLMAGNYQFEGEEQGKEDRTMNKKKTYEYCLYIDCDCVEEFETYDEAEAAYEKAVLENPDSVIDVLSADGETSYMGIN